MSTNINKYNYYDNRKIEKAAEDYAINLDASTLDYKTTRKDFRKGAILK